VLLQASQRPFFLLKTIQRWLTMVLNLIVSVLAVVLAIMAVELREKISPGLLGLALVNVVSTSSPFLLAPSDMNMGNFANVCN
jgi:ATP-binding cassette subfamily C (CFTR/MRP) protein 1